MSVDNQDTEPAAWQGKLVPILGIAILAICLSAAFVQAANTAGAVTPAAPDGLLSESIIGTADLQNGIALEPGADCGEHSIRCYDRSMNVLGDINNAPCYWSGYSCEEDKATDFRRCARMYGATTYVQRTSACSW